jgi:signal transduction histidine kinase
MSSDIDIYVNAHRLRFEAFSIFATNLNKCLSYTDICAVLNSQTKFILDSFVFRIYYKHQSAEIAFEVFQGECKLEQNKVNIASDFEKSVLLQGLPVNFTYNEITENHLFDGTAFANKKIASISALPIVYSANHLILVTVASKEHRQLLELDFRFLKLISELLSNKLNQIKLTETIAAKNEELELKNAQITTLNANLTKTVALRTQELTDSNEELKTLFYRTSHDFRTLLTNIMGLANLASLLTHDTEVLALFDQCKKVADGMDNMLSKLNLLTTDQGNNLQQIDFNKIITASEQKFASRLRACAGKISRAIEPLPEFLSNTDILTNVFDSLIDNSINYNKGQLHIHIELFTGNSSLIIKFTDNGQGIDENMLPKIFDMYYRGNSRSPGHGLGLYIVKKLLKSINGEISAISSLNEFTSFIITLPL